MCCHLRGCLVDVISSKTSYFEAYFTTGGTFHQKGPKTGMNIFYFGPSSTSPEKNYISIYFYKKQRAQNAKGSKLAGHPVMSLDMAVLGTRCLAC